MKTISWFSAGGSSAVATKLMIDEIDSIIYTHIEDQHPDTLRFVKDCEQWFGKPVEILQSPYKTVQAACLAAGGRGILTVQKVRHVPGCLKSRLECSGSMTIHLMLNYDMCGEWTLMKRTELIGLTPRCQTLFTAFL